LGKYMMLKNHTPLTLDPENKTLKPAAMRPTLQDVAQIKHIPCDGVYVKAYRVPAGLQIYSKSFDVDHVTILGQGSVLIDKGEEKLKFFSPAHFIFPANSRYKIITLEDSVWYCVHVTDEKDLAKLQEKY